MVKDLIQGHPKIAFYYLQGNHDEGSFTSGLSEIPENLHLFGNNWTSYELSGTENTSGKGVAVTGVELTPENSGSIYNTLSLDVDQCNIVVLHGQESEYSARDKAEIIHLTALKIRELIILPWDTSTAIKRASGCERRLLLSRLSGGQRV